MSPQKPSMELCHRSIEVFFRFKGSQADTQFLSENVPGSNTPFALRRAWLLIGSFQHPPIIDAVLFFLNEIYPLLGGHLGDAKFYINRPQSASGDRRVGN
jgi:hypothetical protein